MRCVHKIEDDPDATEQPESVLADELDMLLLHVTQRLRDKRDMAAARAALIAELEGQGKTTVEDAGHYADEDALYVSAANCADGEIGCLNSACSICTSQSGPGKGIET